MAIFMKFKDIKGESTTEGFKEWTELTSFEFGIGRRIASAGGTSTREGSIANLSEIVVKKVTDGTTVKYFQQALFGKLDREVEIKMVRVGAGKPEAFLGFKLEGCGVAGLSFRAAGGAGVDSRPGETVHLNFDKITIDYSPIGDDLTGSPDRYMWNLATSTGG